MMRELGQLRRVHMVIAVGGLAALVCLAIPLSWSWAGVALTPGRDGWGMLILFVLCPAVLGGLVEGIAVRTGHPTIAWILLVLVTAAGLVIPADLAVVMSYGAPATQLYYPLSVWLLFAAARFAAAWATSVLGSPATVVARLDGR